MGKRQYKTNKDYKSIAIRFNFKEKEEKKLFVILNSMSSEDRTTFILELYNKNGASMEQNIEKPIEMSIYEKKLFRIVERAIVRGPAPVLGNVQTFSDPIRKKIEVRENKPGNIQSQTVNYDNIDLNSKESEVGVDLEALVDGFTEDGLKE